MESNSVVGYPSVVNNPNGYVCLKCRGWVYNDIGHECPYPEHGHDEGTMDSPGEYASDSEYYEPDNGLVLAIDELREAIVVLNEWIQHLEDKL